MTMYKIKTAFLALFSALLITGAQADSLPFSYSNPPPFVLLNTNNTWSGTNNFNILGANSGAFGGCTIGTDVLCGTGTMTLSGALTAGSFIPTSSSVPPNGMNLAGTNIVGFSTASTLRWTISAGGSFINNISTGPSIINNTASATVPVYVVNKTDTTSGLGGAVSVPAIIVAGATVQSWGTTGTTVTGFVNASNNISLTTSTSAFGLRSGGTLITSPASASLQLGTVDAAAPVAQTLRVQSVVAGTAATSGANWTLIGSLPTGTGTSGDIIFQTGVKTGSGTTQGTATTALTIKGETQAVNAAGAFSAAGAVTLPGLGSSSASTTGTMCWTTGTGNVNIDTTTTCLLSAKKFKQNIIGLDVGLNEIMKLRPVSYELKPQYNPTHLGRQIGLIADEVQKVDPRLVALDDKGDVHGMRYQQLTAVLVKAMQELKSDNDNLRARIVKLEAKK